jgi:ATP-binding cassette subfamily C (CFTR/MRP) protein 1
MTEFGSHHSELTPASATGDQAVQATLSTEGAKLELEEERTVGAVSWGVYLFYCNAIRSWSLVALFVSLLCLTQIASVGTSLVLGFWIGGDIESWGQREYMAVYAGLGLTMALFTVSLTVTQR